MLIIVICAIWASLLFCHILKTGFSTEYFDVKYYPMVVNDIRDKDNAVHFPKTIPPEAKDVQFFYYSSGMGGETLYLGFDIDESYIENEKKKIYLKTVQKDEAAHYFGFARGSYRMSADRYSDFYLIKSELVNPNSEQLFFSGYGGIATKKGSILYYYVNPEG